MSHPDTTRPLPTSLHPNDAAMQAIADAREAALLSRTAVDQLLELAHLANTPPEFLPVTLTAAEPTTVLRSYHLFLSIVIYNPSPATIFLGIGGVSARAASHALSVPPSAMLSLPLPVQHLEVGVDPADVADGDATFFLMRFKTVQPPAFGAL